jgi:restriction system protein
MAIWLTRAGSAGEYEQRFLDENKIILTWDDLNQDLSKVDTREDLINLLNEVFPDNKIGRIRNWAGQIWPIAKVMQKGDWVILPSKKKASIHIGEITGDYVNTPNEPNPYYHYRSVYWFAKDIPRSNFDQDILYSLGAFLTICQIQRNNAEERIKIMAKNSWKASHSDIASVNSSDNDEGFDQEIDLEQLTKDQLAKFIIRKFKGHGLERLIESILQAKGYYTYTHPEGPDKGVDILAAQGSLGFGHPRICVQVKSSDTPVDRPTLDQLIGTMQNFNAENGLLVSWGGFKHSVDKEMASQFFRVRLWDQNTIIEELLDNYDKLDEDIKAEIPLKKIWTLSGSEL